MTYITYDAIRDKKITWAGVKRMTEYDNKITLGQLVIAAPLIATFAYYILVHGITSDKTSEQLAAFRTEVTSQFSEMKIQISNMPIVNAQIAQLIAKDIEYDKQRDRRDAQLSELSSKQSATDRVAYDAAKISSQLAQQVAQLADTVNKLVITVNSMPGVRNPR